MIETTFVPVKIIWNRSAISMLNVLMMVNTKSNPALEKTAIDLLLSRRVEGIIYATMYHRPVKLPQALREIPTVLLDCYVEDRTLPSVVPDEVGGGFSAVSYLLAKGYRRIGFVQNIDDTPATHGRLAGYQQALAQYQKTVQEAFREK